MKQKVIRVGRYSLAVTIPAMFVHGLGIKPGDKVKVEINIDKGIIRLKFTGAIQLALPTGGEKKSKSTASSSE